MPNKKPVFLQVAEKVWRTKDNRYQIFQTPFPEGDPDAGFVVLYGTRSRKCATEDEAKAWVIDQYRLEMAKPKHTERR